MFGKPPSANIMPTAKAINDGFLRDLEKIKSLGFSEEQAEAIIGSKKDKDDARAERFKIAWESRENKDAKPAPIAAATARAIVNGGGEVVRDNPELEDARISAAIQEELSFGKAKTDYAEWKKLNPNATNHEVEEKIRSLAGEDQRRKLSSGIYTEKPARGASPKGADDSTSSVPVGKDITEIVMNFEAGGAPGGFHQTAYWDYGQWSIGYGTKSKKGEVIDQAEAARRLTAELGSHRKRVESAVAKVNLKFTPAQMDALTSFDFNTGKIETLLAGGTRGKREIADTMLLYRNAGGERLRGLEKRRKAERDLFLNGYPGGDEQATAQNTGDLSEYNVIQ
jgi:lysozyme